MEHLALYLVEATGGLAAGLAIGYVFGILQDLAARKNAQLEKEGRLKSAWSVMPGSAGRVAILLAVLALIQVTCPLLFTGGVEWWISGGVAGGYGLFLALRLRRRLRELGS